MIEYEEKIKKVQKQNDAFRQAIKKTKFCFCKLIPSSILILTLSSIPLWSDFNWRTDSDKLIIPTVITSLGSVILHYLLINPHLKRYIVKDLKIKQNKKYFKFWLFWRNKKVIKCQFKKMINDLKDEGVLSKHNHKFNIKRAEDLANYYNTLAKTDKPINIVMKIGPIILSVTLTLFSAFMAGVFAIAHDEKEFMHLVKEHWNLAVLLVLIIIPFSLLYYALVDIIFNAKSRSYQKNYKLFLNIKFHLEDKIILPINKK